MAEERIQETDEGYYVQHGDVLEWQWKGKGPKVEPEVNPVTTAAKPKRSKRVSKR